MRLLVPVIGEAAAGATAIADETFTAINSGLTGYGTTILQYFVKLMPSLATIAAVMFVLYIIKRKVKA